MQLLLIEDDTSIIQFLTPLLEAEGYELFCSQSIGEAEMILRTRPIDLILLDLGLPDKDGLSFLEEFRKESAIPIIVISARSDEKTKVAALDLDADDYLTKPFGSSELLARIRTATRHFKKMTAQEQSSILKNGPLSLDKEKREVLLDGILIHLTKNEFLLLQILLENTGKVLTHDYLSKAVWGLGSMNPLTLRVNLSNLRKKIEKNPIEPQFIQTEIGVGYRMREL